MEILQFLTDVGEIKEGDVLSDHQLLEIYNSVTEEDWKSYQNTIEEYLNVPRGSDLKTAVSCVYLKLYLLEKGLIEKGNSQS